MERILKQFTIRTIYLLLLTIAGNLHAIAQSIVLPSPIDSLTDLNTYVEQPFSFNSNTIDAVDLFTGLIAPHCKAQQDCGALPVYLLSFDGKRQDREHALLNWKTTNEINSKGFDIERSLGDMHNFLDRGFVTSFAGPAYEKKYEFRDENNYPGTSYYRLKQIDNDGQFTYSQVVAVKGFGFDESLIIYPNPAKDYLTLNINVLKASTGTLTITDVAGKTVINKPINLLAGTNNARLIISNIKAGLYTIKLQRTNAIPLIKNLVKY